MLPHDIETKSFSIIDREAGVHGFSDAEWTVVRRMIHTTADFEYLESVRFSPRVVHQAVAALQNGVPVITDTNMVRVGIRMQRIEELGGEVACFINDPRVVAQAAAQKTTKARVAVDLAAELYAGGIYVIGNAPTALLRLLEVVAEGRAKPDLIIGLPVGFVNAAESKELLCGSATPFISNVGRKGGSNLAAAVVNALLVLATGREAYQ